MEYFTNKYSTSNDKEFYVNQGMLGAPTSPQTANQLQEATSRLNAGLKNVELSLVDPNVFESIPKQHFAEVKRLGKLTNAKASLHFPAQIDLAGFAREGWSERSRMQAEYQLKSGIDKAADLGNNTILNVHSSGGVPAYEWQAEKNLGDEKGYPPEGKKKIFVLDRADPRHQIAPLEYEEKEYFGGTKIWTPEDRRNMLNKSQWDQEKLQLFNYEKEKAEINDRLQRIDAQISPLESGYEKKVLTNDELIKLDTLKKEEAVMLGHIDELNTHMDSQLQDLHDKFSKYAPEKEKDAFEREYRKKFGDLIDFSKKEMEFSRDQKELFEKYRDNSREEIREKMGKQLEKKYGKRFIEDLHKPGTEQKRRQDFLNIIQSMPTPERFITTDEFAKEKLSQTVSDSALYAYKKYGKDAPIISVENVMPDWTLGKGDTLRDAVLESRKQFSDKLVKEKNLSRSEAGKIAEKLIGATWDVGHISQLKKFGYSDKQIAEEARQIAPVVKHVHITDNFGFNDTHLPPGMGSVNIKEQIQEIKKKLGEKEYGKLAHIVEAGGFVAQFKTSPHPQTLEYFDSPLYTHKAMPYWSEVSQQQAEYSMGYGIQFPQKHFETYGAGFSNLPTELGGQAQQREGSRFSGNPME